MDLLQQGQEETSRGDSQMMNPDNRIDHLRQELGAVDIKLKAELKAEHKAGREAERAGGRAGGRAAGGAAGITAERVTKKDSRKEPISRQTGDRNLSHEFGT